MTDRTFLHLVSRAVNRHLNGGQCPSGNSLGECPAVHEAAAGHCMAHVYLWPAGQGLKPAEVAQWFIDAGALDVHIDQQLHDPDNEVADGRCSDGAVSWVVHFTQGGHFVDAVQTPAPLLQPCESPCDSRAKPNTVEHNRTGD